MRLFVVAFTVVITLPVVFYHYAATRFIFNWDDSIPRGLYRLSHDPSDPEAVFCMDEQYAPLFQNRVPPGPCPGNIMPAIKPQIRATVIHLTRYGLGINGQLMPNTAPKPFAASGAPLLPCPYGEYRPRSNEVWSFSYSNPDSFDSRYYCSIPRDRVIAYARPLWTF